MRDQSEPPAFTREDVVIHAAYDLDAWLYRPPGDGPHPAIVMSHGLAAVKDQYLDHFAAAFAEAGFAVICFEHRGFGRSGGPRLDIDPWAQVEDARAAISYAQSLDFVDADRIGVWGTSFSGGHAIVLGAVDRRVRSVVAQVPTVDGHESFLRRLPPHGVAPREAGFAEERRRLFAGETPTMLDLLPGEGVEHAVFSDPEAIAFFDEVESRPESFEAKMTLLSVERARDYDPAHYIARIAPTPLLMIVADDDTVVMTDLNLEAFETAHEPKRLEMFRGAHWSPYAEARDQAVSAALDWFTETLRDPALPMAAE